jgi:hypothetical protein
MRRPGFAAPILLALLVPAAAAAAEDGAAGRWVVSGRVAGFAFTVACDLKQAGEALSGVCVDTSTSDAKVKAGRRHALTRGHVSGDHVSWTYSSSFLFSTFDVDYAGARVGDHMTGQITVQGRTGAFTADRAAN